MKIKGVAKDLEHLVYYFYQYMSCLKIFKYYRGHKKSNLNYSTEKKTFHKVSIVLWRILLVFLVYLSNEQNALYDLTTQMDRLTYNNAVVKNPNT